MKTISNREINVKSNRSAKTFTIRVESSKYRTNRLTKAEFANNEYNTANDWQNFLQYSSDHYPVR